MGNSAEERPLSKEEMLQRLVGRSYEHDHEDIDFWRNASEELRGLTLYRLLARGRALRASGVQSLAEDTERMVLHADRIEILRRT